MQFPRRAIVAVGVAGAAAGGGAVAMASTGDAKSPTKGFTGGHDRFGGGHRGDADHSRGHGTTRKQRGG
jgi:hypothetical protein